MASDRDIAMDDINKRLISFQEYPLPESLSRKASLLGYNSPLKLANSGFFRSSETPYDEVKCFSCGVCYRGWNGESPNAVHRILYPECKYLISVSPRLTGRPPRAGTGSVRRRLEFETPLNSSNEGDNDDQRSVLDVYDRFQNPATPETSDTEDEIDDEPAGSMYFESHRLLTYPSPTHPRAEEWAKEGFIYRDGVVLCVFCQVVFPYDASLPSETHRKQSKNCPIVRLIDVGNIPKELEDKIRSNSSTSGSYELCESDSLLYRYPQFEEPRFRLDTFILWSKQIRPVPSDLSEAGFFFTGYGDKVMCFACGYGMYNWDPKADPWTQHAKHSPCCVFLQLMKGDNFIKEAEEAQVLSEFEVPEKDSHSEPGTNVTSGFRPSLDMKAIKAALACQYDVRQIRHAVLKFFILSCGKYPNEALLLGMLRASDENFSVLQRLRDTVHNNHINLQHKDQVIGEKNQVIGEKNQVIGEKNQVIEQVIEDRDEVIEEKDEEIERVLEREQRQRHELQGEIRTLNNRLHGQSLVIQTHTNQLQVQDTELERKESELERKQREFERQTREMRRQAEDMRRQAEDMRQQAERIQQLEQLLQANNITDNNLNNNANPASGLNNANNAVVPVGGCSCRKCGICSDEEVQCLFIPCSHIYCGTRCASYFVNKDCPVCRSTVQDWQLVFIA